MEQAVFRYSAGVPGLWLADADWLCGPGRGAHGAFFPMELWILSQPSSAAGLPGRIVFPCVLFLQGGASAPALDPGHPGQAAAVCGPAVRSGADSDPCPLPMRRSPGGRILCVAVWMDELWGAGSACAVDSDSADYFLPGGGPDADPLQLCSDLRSYGGSDFIDYVAPAPGNQFFIERLFLSISVDHWNIRPSVSYSRLACSTSNDLNRFGSFSYCFCC